MKIEGIDTFVALGKDNAEAFVRSGTAALKGLEELTKASQALATRQAEAFDTALRALFACKSPVEVADLQGRLLRQGIETAIAESRHFAELATNTYTAALEPLNAQVAAFQAKVKSAA